MQQCTLNSFFIIPYGADGDGSRSQIHDFNPIPEAWLATNSINLKKFFPKNTFFYITLLT